MKLSEDLLWRGLIKDKTFDDVSWLDTPRTFYHGVDASSDSLTIGNLAAMLLSRRLIDAGWNGVLLAGGATSLIGDPKETEERELKPREEIVKNVEAIKVQINKLFDGKDFTLVDNYDWFKDVGYLDFLREVGKKFGMNELMQREFVTERLDSGISYAEFSYSLIQGYDYLQLFKDHGCVLQIGGSDQWGNMLSGVSLIRKSESQEAHAFSMPLVINKETGTKFGKSEEGAVWLDANKTTVFKFYQFWINVSDADVEEFLKIYTFLSKEEIEGLVIEHGKNPSERVAQIKLAEEVTKLVHGVDQMNKARNATNVVLGKTSIGDVSEDILTVLREELPRVEAQLGDEVAVKLAEAGLVTSNREGREIRAAGGVYINNQGDTTENFEFRHFSNGRLILRKGKKFQDSALIELK